MQPRTLPITGIPIGQIPASVLVCGDPERATGIANAFDDSSLISDNREYRCLAGSYQGTPVAVCSHGIGAPGASIAFEELISAGAQRIIRVGTCGGLRPDIVSGHIIVATAAVQNTGYGREVVPDGYPAAADVSVTSAIMQAAAGFNHPCSSGYVLTRDSFYKGVGPPSMPDYSKMAQANVLAVEMECAALFIVAALRRVQAGAITVVDGNVLSSGGESMESYNPDNNVVHEAVNIAALIALNALTNLSNGSN